MAVVSVRGEAEMPISGRSKGRQVTGVKRGTSRADVSRGKGARPVRFDELSLRIPGDELRIRFHERLTIIGGIGALERQGLIDGLLGTLTGRHRQDSVLVFADATGRLVEVTRDQRRELIHRYEDGTAAPDPMALIGLDAAGLHELCRLGTAEVGLLGATSSDRGTRTAEPAELVEARDAMARIAEEFEEALRAATTAASLGEELAAIDEALREGEEGQARRRYARLLADLERVRAEAVALRGGSAGAEADGRLLSAGQDVHRLSARWHQAHRRMQEATARFGGRTRLDPRAFADAHAVPDRVPTELSELAERMAAAEAHRDAIAARLQTLAASRLPNPSDPAVMRLANSEQDGLWHAARRVIDTREQVEAASLELGGIDAGGMGSRLAEEIEAAHERVAQAEALLRTRRRAACGGVAAGIVGALIAMSTSILLAPGPLVLGVACALWGMAEPRQALARARAAAQGTLGEAGTTSYLAFQMRRIDATIDPTVRTRLVALALEHRVAKAEWHDLVGDIDAAHALSLEVEVRRYAEALDRLDDKAEEIEQLRRELANVAEPAATRARADLMAACAPFGVDDPALAVDMVRHQVEEGRTARLQAELETAEAEEAALRVELDALLAQLGVAGSDLTARLGALDRALAAAREREQARGTSRAPAEIDAELAQLEAAAKRDYRPEWGASVAPDDLAEPDIESLRARRDATAKAWAEAQRAVPDVERLADRHAAVERRVTILEAAMGDSPAAAALVATQEIERYLQARLAALCSATPQRDPLPLVLDEPFLRIRGERKAELLDFVARLSERTQLVYLTDDADVLQWARPRAGNGLLLLEPTSV
jgi:hypothetical protein